MNLYIYCGGGFGKEVFDVAHRANAKNQRWEEINFVDDFLKERTKYGARVLTFDQVAAEDRFGESEFIVASGEPIIRLKIRKKLEGVAAKLGRIIDSSSILAQSAHIGDGVIIAPFCSISSDTILARNSCVNTMSIVGHDVSIGENSVISSMVNIGGGCIVGESSYIGMGALIKEGIKIGSNSIVGMGSVVYDDIPDGVIALGNPARVMRNNTDQKVFK
jgi:sugar O-acyltransferase (sialic acid O-acetyltransferase NeuD family)